MWCFAFAFSFASMADSVVSIQYLKDFFNSQIYDDEKWAFNVVISLSIALLYSFLIHPVRFFILPFLFVLKRNLFQYRLVWLLCHQMKLLGSVPCFCARQENRIKQWSQDCSEVLQFSYVKWDPFLTRAVLCVFMLRCLGRNLIFFFFYCGMNGLSLLPPPMLLIVAT